MLWINYQKHPESRMNMELCYTIQTRTEFIQNESIRFVCLHLIWTKNASIFIFVYIENHNKRDNFNTKASGKMKQKQLRSHHWQTDSPEKEADDW